jgi:uncharacterized membrane-anchored protein
MIRKILASALLRLVLAVGVQLLLVLGMLTPALTAKIGAQEITLRTAPVDPRDLLRGNYLTLSYDVSTVKAAGAELNTAGQLAYLPVRQVGEIWTGDQATEAQPEGGVYLRGRVVYKQDGRVRINFGIERFYLSEGAAAQNNRATAGLLARVTVGRGGKAYLHALTRNGELVR